MKIIRVKFYLTNIWKWCIFNSRRGHVPSASQRPEAVLTDKASPRGRCSLFLIGREEICRKY